jgi:hypothetical protein
MTSRYAVLAWLACAAASGCAFVPQRSPMLEEAGSAYASAIADPRIASLAGAELQAARELLDRANVARNKLDDIAEVDHLAYLAKQRVAIGREAAVLRAAAQAAR